MVHVSFLIAFILALSGTAFAESEMDKIITPGDRQRLENFDSVKAVALREAWRSEMREDIEALDTALSGTPLSLTGNFDATGNWRCRTIKLGGDPVLVAYPWFKCRINDDGSGWVLEKTTGSQRTQGRFFTASDTRMIYLGASFVTGEAPRNYGAAEKENQVAVMERLGENRLVLQFPSPFYESKFDLLVLER